MGNKYIPLYRKYRPQTFHDLIGQENIVHAISKAIELNRIAHAYLFCGPRGTGKTSSARILAKSLNCQNGPTLTPCGKCPACLDILNSIPVDVIEIDAASNRSVEDTQAILEKIQYVPVNGKYKIYVIDEVHMLTAHAFNSLLKTLEEPPSNVIFILATTEPHKVLDTIISRCQRFDFRRITTNDIVKRLEYISKEENINISNEALYTIAKNSQGGMRDSLSLLDQVSVLSATKQIDVSDINEILGKISFEALFEITEHILEADCSKSVPLINKIYTNGNEPIQILTNLIQYFRDLMIIRNCSDKDLITSLTQITVDNIQKVHEQANKFSASEIIQVIDRFSYYINQIRNATNKYLWLEMCIIDLTNYKNLPSAENLLKRIEELEQKLANGIPPVATSSKVVNSVKPTPIAKPVSQPQPSVAPQQQVQQPQPLQKPQQPRVETPKPTPITPSEAKSSDLHSLWVSIIQSIDSVPTRAFYSSLAKPVEITDSKVVIAVKTETFANKAKEPAKMNALNDAVCRYLSIKSTNIEVVIGDNVPQVTKTTIAPPPAPPKVEQKKDLVQQEEEEYHNFIQAKEEEQKAPPKYVDASTQAAMVQQLFGGKYID